MALHECWASVIPAQIALRACQVKDDMCENANWWLQQSCGKWGLPAFLSTVTFLRGEVYGNARGLGHQKPLHTLKTKQNPNTPTKKAQETFAFLDFCRDKKRLQNSGIDDFLDFVALGFFFLLDSGHGGVDTVLKHKLVWHLGEGGGNLWKSVLTV